MSVAKTSIGLLLCGLVLGPLTGCTAFQSVCSKQWMEGAFSDADPPIDHVAVRWDDRLRTAQNPADYTSGIPGLIGRVYLISEQTNQMCEARGTIVVGMLDMTPTAQGKPPVPVAEWVFDEEYLKKHKVKDPISNVAYTVFLASKEYRPEMRKVKLLVKYVTRNGEQHMADHSLLTLQTSDQPAATLRETVGTKLDRQFDMQAPMPAQRLQGASQGMPYTPVQMDKIMPPPGPTTSPSASGYKQNAPDPQADAPFQPIIMNPQSRNPGLTPPAIAPDILPTLPADKTTIRYLPPSR
jgi:hypothetical protein